MKLGIVREREREKREGAMKKQREWVATVYLQFTKPSVTITLIRNPIKQSA